MFSLIIVMNISDFGLVGFRRFDRSSGSPSVSTELVAEENSCLVFFVAFDLTMGFLVLEPQTSK